MRNELYACKEKGIFDIIVWVDRSEHLPPEPKSSMDITKSDADVTIDNNGTLEDLAVNVDAFLNEHFPAFVKEHHRDRSLDFKPAPHIADIPYWDGPDIEGHGY